MLYVFQPLDHVAEGATSEEATGVRPGVLAAGLQALVPDIKQEDDISSSDLLQLAVRSLLIDAHHPLIGRFWLISVS